MHYLAYGSNLHPLRLRERVPSARLLDVLELPEYRLGFHKLGRDGSGKCSIIHTRNPDDSIFAALYKIAAREKADLDCVECKGCGYSDVGIRVNQDKISHSCFTYIAQSTHIDASLRPYHWYKSLVTLGAEYLGLPSWYTEAIHSVESVEDPDEFNRAHQKTLVTKLRKANQLGFYRI